MTTLSAADFAAKWRVAWRECAYPDATQQR